jgi:GTP1/Obg family GTP-binding protein
LRVETGKDFEVIIMEKLETFDEINIGRVRIIDPFDKLKNDLSDLKNELIEELKRYDDNNKKMDIISDIDRIGNSISQIDNVKNTINTISRKYGWDK